MKFLISEARWTRRLPSEVPGGARGGGGPAAAGPARGARELATLRRFFTWVPFSVLVTFGVLYIARIRDATLALYLCDILNVPNIFVNVNVR